MSKIIFIGLSFFIVLIAYSLANSASAAETPTFIYDYYDTNKPFVEIGTDKPTILEIKCVIPTLKFGSRSNEVKWVQIYLKGRYGYKGAIDGIFSKSIVKSLKALQKKKGYRQTGVVDKETAMFFSSKVQQFYNLQCRGVTSAGKRDEQRIKDLKTIRQALSSYFTDTGKYPIDSNMILGGLNALVLSKDNGFAADGSGKIYLKKVPHNPSPGGGNYVYSALVDGNEGGECTVDGSCNYYSIEFKLEGPVLTKKISKEEIMRNPSLLYNDNQSIVPKGDNVVTPYDTW